MADTLDRFTRRVKRFYEEIVTELMGGKQGIDKFLFAGVDVDKNSSQMAIDELIVQPHGVSFRQRGEQSAVRPYVPGEGHVYPIPTTSEKTPITETLRDAVIAGGEATEGFSSRHLRLTNSILRQHTIAHMVTRWKLSIDVMRNGIFTATGTKGESIGLDIDFDRDASLNLTYNFTDSGANIISALQAMYTAYRAKNGVSNNVIVLVGEDWLEKFETNTSVQKFFEANPNNVLLAQEMAPPELKNTQGLNVVATYRLPKKSVKLTICTFTPRGQFIPYKGASAVDFMPSDEAIMFSMDDSPFRYKVQRGVDIPVGKKIQKFTGDVVLDWYFSNDPVEEYLRSQARYAFVPANVNNTCRSTGTFA